MKKTYRFIDDTEERHAETEYCKFNKSDSVINSGSWEITIIIHLSHIQKSKSARFHLPEKKCQNRMLEVSRYSDYAITPKLLAGQGSIVEADYVWCRLHSSGAPAYSM